MAVQGFLIDKFYWGISDDNFIWQEGTFQDGAWIEIRRDPRGVTLNTALTTGYDLDWKGEVISDIRKFTTSSNAELVVGTDNGSIYKNGVKVASWLSAVKNFSSQVIWWTSSLVVLTSWTSKYITFGNALSWDTLNSWNANLVSLGGSSPSTNADDPMPVIFSSTKDLVIFWWGRDLCSIDTSWSITVHTQLPNTSERFTYISEFADQIRAFTMRGATKQRGNVYVYPTATSFATTSENPSYSIVLEWLPVKTGINLWGTDLLFTGYGWPKTSTGFTTLSTLASMYQYSWYQKQLLHRNKPGEEKLHFFGQFANAVGQTEWTSYFSGQNGIYSYGTFLGGFPPSLNLDFALTSTDTTNEWIHAIETDEDNIYVTYNDGTDDKFVSFPFTPGTYTASGSVTTRVLSGQTVSQKKSWKSLFIGYDISSTNGYGGTIDILARPNTWAAWQTVGSITDTTTKKKEFYEAQLPFKDFSTLEIKATLNSGDTNTTTPILYDISGEYDLIDNHL